MDIIALAIGNKANKRIDGIEIGGAPYIGVNGNWYVWNKVSVSYIDSGIMANGITPHIDNDTGNWFIGNVDTGITANGYNPTVTIKTNTDTEYILTVTYKNEIGDIITYDTPNLKTNSADGIYTNANPVEIEVGNIKKGLILENKTFGEIFDLMFFNSDELYPSFVDPFAIITTDREELQEIGNVIDIKFNAVFDRGQINPSYGTSGFRSGLPNSYHLGNNVINSSSLILDYTIYNHTVQDETLIFTNYVNFDIGEQPLTNKGNNFDIPLPAGKTIDVETKIIGVYPTYATTITGALIKQPLTLMNEPYFELEFAAEDDVNKQKFLIYSNIDIIGIQQYDILIEDWVWIKGNEINSLTTFDIDSEFIDINGNMVEYISYTNNLPKIGKRQIRFIQNI